MNTQYIRNKGWWASTGLGKTPRSRYRDTQEAFQLDLGNYVKSESNQQSQSKSINRSQ